MPCAEAVFARGLCAASPVFAAAEVVFVQITGKMGPLYHFVSRVVRCASFYIPSPIAGNHPFTEAAASSSVTTGSVEVRKDETIVAAFQTNHTGARGG